MVANKIRHHYQKGVFFTFFFYLKKSHNSEILSSRSHHKLVNNARKTITRLERFKFCQDCRFEHFSHKVFNSKCLSVLSGHTIAQETRKPSFDILTWIRWRRLTWLGKILRVKKWISFMFMLKFRATMATERRTAGDVFTWVVTIVYGVGASCARCEQVTITMW